MAKYNISVRDGKKAVSGMLVGKYLGIRKDPESKAPWVIDHIPSGLRVGEFKRKGDAKVIAESFIENVGEHNIGSDNTNEMMNALGRNKPFREWFLNHKSEHRITPGTAGKITPYGGSKVAALKAKAGKILADPKKRARVEKTMKAAGVRTWERKRRLSSSGIGHTGPPYYYLGGHGGQRMVTVESIQGGSPAPRKVYWFVQWHPPYNLAITEYGGVFGTLEEAKTEGERIQHAGSKFTDRDARDPFRIGLTKKLLKNAEPYRMGLKTNAAVRRAAEELVKRSKMGDNPVYATRELDIALATADAKPDKTGWTKVPKGYEKRGIRHPGTRAEGLMLITGSVGDWSANWYDKQPDGTYEYTFGSAKTHTQLSGIKARADKWLAGSDEPKKAPAPVTAPRRGRLSGRGILPPEKMTLKPLHVYPLRGQEYVVTKVTKDAVHLFKVSASEGEKREVVQQRWIAEDMIAEDVRRWKSEGHWGQARPYKVQKVNGTYDWVLPKEKGVIVLLEPRMNKQNDWSEYTRQLPGGSRYKGFIRVLARVVQKKKLTAAEYDRFVESFLTERDWLAKGGGPGERVKGVPTNKVIEITAPGRNKIYANPEGYDYARYVLFPKDARSSWKPVKPGAKTTAAKSGVEGTRRPRVSEPTKKKAPKRAAKKKATAKKKTRYCVERKLSTGWERKGGTFTSLTNGLAKAAKLRTAWRIRECAPEGELGKIVKTGSAKRTSLSDCASKLGKRGAAARKKKAAKKKTAAKKKPVTQSEQNRRLAAALRNV